MLLFYLIRQPFLLGKLQKIAKKTRRRHTIAKVPRLEKHAQDPSVFKVITKRFICDLTGADGIGRYDNCILKGIAADGRQGRWGR